MFFWVACNRGGGITGTCGRLVWRISKSDRSESGSPLRRPWPADVVAALERCQHCERRGVRPSWNGALSTDKRNRETLGKLYIDYLLIAWFSFFWYFIKFYWVLFYTKWILYQKINAPPFEWNAEILPPVRNQLEYLRSRGHDFTLPSCTKDLYKKSFVMRCLFNFM